MINLKNLVDFTALDRRGVATGGGRVGRYAPPASENFVFFECQNRKKVLFQGCIAARSI
jgi:hypothetical protein